MPHSFRVLVVEDFEPFRRFLSSALQKVPGLQVVGEVSDGLEATQQAEKLQPDLVLLDIGLPTLNGIDAARRIRKLAPECKLLFVSQETSVDIVQEALSLGALGYVVKAHAGSELLAAVEAVCQNRQFVSSVLSGHDFTDASDAQVPDLLCHEEALPSLAQRKGETTRSHEVQFYSDDAFFLEGFRRFIEASLKAGKAVIVVATEAHRNSLFQGLQARGLDIGAAIERGSLIPLDVAETLSTFMVNDLPDPVRFRKVAGDLSRSSRLKRRGGSNPELQLVVNVHLSCGRKVRRMRRFRSNTFGTR
jgi:DNA-binding NarL/FixJ family response regulator